MWLCLKGKELMMRGYLKDNNDHLYSNYYMQDININALHILTNFSPHNNETEGPYDFE